MVVLAIDIGTHAVRAALVEQGQILVQKQCNISLSRLSNTEVEQNPNEILANTLECLQAIAVAEVCAKGVTISAAMACQRSSVLAWCSTTGEPLSPVLSWQDTRGGDAIKALSLCDKQTIRDRTGLYPSAHYGASKLALLQSQHLQTSLPQSQPQLQTGPLSCWLANRLCGWQGDAKCDESMAARTLLWNIHTRQWDPTLCEMFGVNIASLPAVAPVYSHFGDFSFGGLTVELKAVCGDQNAAYLSLLNPLCNAESSFKYNSQLSAQSNSQPKTLINLGSGAFVLQTGSNENQRAASLKTSVQTLLQTLVASSKHDCTFAFEGTVNGAGVGISEFCRAEGITEKDFFNCADAITPKNTSALYTNGIGGLASPWWVPLPASKVGRFYDLKHNEKQHVNLQEQVTAVLESIAFMIYENIQLMPINNGVWVTGGLSRCNYLNQVLASLMGGNLNQIMEPELTLLGTAKLAGDKLPVSFPETQIITSNVAGRANILSRYIAWKALINKFTEVRNV